ncbi:hypothetical protein I5U32_01070 [Stenotrophomonas maltophilia]|nr:hypothetical protein [Stenotrophomonas maltophilia]MBH1534081.1 hypothetical protein [Stenotrophomonas maltophilia]
MSALERAARSLLCMAMRLPPDGVTAELMMDLSIPQLGIVPTAAALSAIRTALAPNWKPIAEAPQDGTRLMLWDSVSKRPLFGSWRGDNPTITHYAAEPAGPEVA